MVGELGLRIKKVSFSNDMLDPYDQFSDSYIDMNIIDDENSALHICGKNDWGYLLVDAIKPLLNRAHEIERDIDSRLMEYNGHPETIGLGKNAYRALDIAHRLSHNGEPIKNYKLIPVVQLNYDKGIKLFGFTNIYDEELPFK